MFKVMGYIIRVKHVMGFSYLAFKDDKPVLVTKRNATLYNTELEANDASCYLQEIWVEGKHIKCDIIGVSHCGY